MKRVATLMISTAVFFLTAVAPHAAAAPDKTQCGICWEVTSTPR